MSLPSDLLDQARFLLKREPKRPKQASLRRAISAAYYSLFHLLIDEASRAFAKSEAIAGMISRSYGHGTMLKVSKEVAKGMLPRRLNPLKATLTDPTRRVIHDKLKSVAQAFVDLQEARHEADYNVRKNFTRSEAEAFVKRAEKASSDWMAIHKDDLARIFLGSFLLWDSWDKER